MTPGFVAINLAYLALLAGAFSQSLNRVRVLLVSAAVFFISYGLIAGIGSMVVWNLIIGGLNLRRLCASVVADLQVSLTAEHEVTRRRHFDNLCPARFSRLWDLGQEFVPVDEPIPASEGGSDRIHLVLRGTVEVVRDGTVVNLIGPGSLIDGSATRWISDPVLLLARGAVRSRVWSRDELDRHGLLRDLFSTVGHQNGYNPAATRETSPISMVPMGIMQARMTG